MTDIDINPEERLRAHIRNLLLDYALTYLTTDYVQLTQNAVSQLLSEALFEIPTIDPRSPFLPEDPFDTLSRIHGIGTPESFADLEKFQADNEAYNYLKRILKSRPGHPKSETIGYEDWSEHDLSIYRLMQSVLATRSLRGAPKLGTNTFLKSLPAKYSAFLPFQSIKSVNVEAIEEPEAKLEQVLDVAGWHDAIFTAARAFLKSTFAPSKPGSTYTNPYLDPISLVEDIAPVAPFRLPGSPPFVPIFPRTRVPGSGVTDGRGVPGLGSTGDLSAVIMPKVNVEDADLFKEHMVVVDGWHTYNTSSPLSTPPSSQGEEQIDQLFLQSSPDTDPVPIQILMDAKMDIIQIPRTQRIGGVQEKAKPISGDKSLASFLLPLLPASRTPNKFPTSIHKAEPETVKSEFSLSMLGQPPSAHESHALDVAEVTDIDDLDVDIKNVYGILGVQDPKDILRNAKLDEEDHRLLMDVPLLPEPNEHAPNIYLPLTRLRELVVPRNPDRNNEQKCVNGSYGLRAPLRKAKGVQSLGLQLSWVPFKPLDHIPTHEELARVTTFGRDDDLKNEDSLGPFGNHAQVLSLLERSAVTGKDSEYIEQEHWRASDDKNVEVDGEFSAAMARCEIILTRDERRRIADLPRYGDSGADNTDSEEEGENDDVNDCGDQDKVDYHEENQTDAIQDSNPRPTKRVRTESICDNNLPCIDDSGIAFDTDFDDLRGIQGQRVDDVTGPASRTLDPQDDDDVPFYLDENKENEPPMIYPEYADGVTGTAFSSLDDFSAFSFDVDQPLMPGPGFPPALPDQHFYQSLSGGHLSHGKQENDGVLTFETEDSAPLHHAPALDVEGGFMDDRGGFWPLSFGSYQAPSVRSSQFQEDIAVNGGILTQDNSRLTLNDSNHSINPYDKHVHLDPVEDKLENYRSQKGPPVIDSSHNELPTQSSGINAFVKLRGKIVTQRDSPPAILVPTCSDVPSHLPEQETQPRPVPEEIFDHSTLRIPSPWNIPTTVHKYMASMDVIQKQALVRSLRSRECVVDLVERETLGGVDLILDPHTAILLAPLLVLPSQREALTVRIAEQSWRYLRLLVIFEAYPASQSYRAKPISDDRDATTPYAYSPPVLKAIKKLRRDLGIAEGAEAKRLTTEVQFAFADNVEGVALFVRSFGDIAEANDRTGGATWGAREWLDDEVNESEEELAAVDGMNRFAAAMILCQNSLQDFVNLSSAARMHAFGHTIGIDKIASINGLIEHRLREIESSDPFDEVDVSQEVTMYDY